MKNKTMKIIAFLLMVVICLSVSTLSFAATGDKKGDTTTPADPEPKTTTTTKAQDIIDDIDITGDVGDVGNLPTFVEKIVNVIFYVGVTAGLIVIMYLGVKYIIGSPEQKSDYKKSFTPYIVGVILLVGASAIAKFIFSFSF